METARQQHRYIGTSLNNPGCQRHTGIQKCAKPNLREGTYEKEKLYRVMCEYVTPEILSLIEDGKLPTDIAKKVLNTDDDTLLQPGERPEKVPESFPEEVVTISQALAYRRANINDVSNIFEVLNSSYVGEICGDESFRIDEPVISRDKIASSMCEGGGGLSWLIMEVPEGRGTSADGSIIAVCAFTTDGISRRNGEIEGNLGSIRLFSVLPKYQGLYIGVRLLDKLEMTMRASNRCVRMMFSIPSTRKSMLKWAERQQFVYAGMVPYPKDLGHTLKTNDVKLHVYLRPIVYNDASNISDAKNSEGIETVLRLNSNDDYDDVD